MKTVIFGFSGCGKTTLFNALAGPDSATTNRAMIKVPEPRLAPLIDLYTPKKITLTEIEIVDLPGGGGKGQGLGDRVLNEIRPYDCLLAVLDGFSGVEDPKVQQQNISADLVIADLAVIEKKLERMAQDGRKNKSLVDPKEEQWLKKAKDLLENETPLRQDPEVAHCPELRGYRFLTAKPILYVINCSESSLAATELPKAAPGEAYLAASVQIEKELAEIADPEERKMFLADLGIESSVLDRVIAKTYELLGLITFLTAGDKEVRSWTIERGAKAPEAAGAIHSDIQKGFIRAEVLGYQDFLACKDFKTARERGVLRLEGKEYVVQDGDIIEFRFNV